MLNKPPTKEKDPARRRAMLIKVASFATVGLINTGVDFVLFLLIWNRFTESLILTNVITWSIAVSGSYVMNSYLTFAAESGRKLTWRAYATFMGAQVIGLIAATTALVLAAKFLPVIAAKLISIAVSFLVNFTMSHFVVYRRLP